MKFVFKSQIRYLHDFLDCKNAPAMENGKIPDDQITASSQW